MLGEVFLHHQIEMSLRHACWAVEFVQLCSSWSTWYLGSFWDWQTTTSQDEWMLWSGGPLQAVSRAEIVDHTPRWPYVAIWRVGDILARWCVSNYVYTLRLLYIPCSSSVSHHFWSIIRKLSKIDCQLGVSDNGVRLIILPNIMFPIRLPNVCSISFAADFGRYGAQHEPIHWCFSIRDLHGVFTGATFFQRSTPSEIQWCINYAIFVQDHVCTRVHIHHKGNPGVFLFSELFRMFSMSQRLPRFGWMEGLRVYHHL